MAESWFRMHANIADKQVAWRLKKATSITLAEAIGHLAMFWGKVSQLAPKGDISQVDDEMLERWGGWNEKHNKPGQFASWVRSQHVTDNRVNEADEYNGPLEAKREADRVRQQNRRSKTHVQSEDVTRDVAATPGVTSGDSHKSPGVTSTRTKRSEAKRDETDETDEAKQTDTISAFVKTFYGVTTKKRRDAVLAEMAASLAEGVRFRDGTTKATDRAHLLRVLQDVIDHPPRDYDKAWPIALEKLSDPEPDLREGSANGAKPRSIKKTRDELVASDVAKNKEPRTTALVMAYAKVNPDWFDTRKAEAHNAGRWAYPYAREWIEANDAEWIKHFDAEQMAGPDG